VSALSRLARALLRGPRALHADESGAAMVEFVLVFPVQLLITLVILQFAFVAHAHLVVEQAAFLGARAGAVADCDQDAGHTDVAAWKASGKRAAENVAARTIGVLTSGEPPTTPSASTVKLEWTKGDGTKFGFSAVRQQEAFAHMKVTFEPYPADAYVSCEIEYDYTMMIPVANHLFARAQTFFWQGPVTAADYAGTPSAQRGKTVFRIKRVSFIPTPWTRAPR
jgi:Flp pilus assembly protein TadG